MKKIIFSVLAIASVLFTGCNVKEFAPAVPVQDGLVRVSASIDATKIGVGAEAGKYAWEAGDVIGVWTGAAFTPFTIENASVGKAAGTFAGTLPEGGAINEASYAVYPYCEEDVLDGTNYTSKYEGNNWEFKSLVPLAAKPTATVDGSTVASFKFSHLTALALLKLKNIPVDAKSIFFESTKQLFFISGTADLSAEYPKFTVEETADYCFMDIPEHSKPIDMTIFVPLNMGEFADPKFRFTLFSCTTGDDFEWGAEMEKATYNHAGFLSTGGFINRGDLYVLPEVNFGGNAPSDGPVDIAIDGDFEDWNNINIAAVERTDDMDLKVLKTVKYFADAEYMYVYMEIDKARQFGSVADFNIVMDFYIDADGDPATGGLRSDVYNHGIDWYWETNLCTDNGPSNWLGGQYEFTGADGAAIWGNLNDHGTEYFVETAADMDADADFAVIEAKFKRSDLKLVNTKAAFGLVLMDGSESWTPMGKLPQNSELSMFTMDLPEFAGSAEPAEGIIIDGNFEDWNDEGIATLTLQEGAALKVLKTAKFFADEEYLYVYMKLADVKANNTAGDDNVMMDFYIDADGNPATGGIRGDVFNHGVNWYYETFLCDPGNIGHWNSGQYEYNGADGGSIWSLTNHGGEYPVLTGGYYDEASDSFEIEARLNRTDFKLVNTKAAFGIAILEGSSSGWPAMGKLPQNDDLSMFVMDLPAIAGGAAPEKVQVTIDGNMAEWANVTTGIEDANGPYYAFKATYDDEYVYVYSKRDFRNTYWGGNGYFYYYFDLDNNPETGIEHSGIAGIESFVFLYPFGGTNDAPAITVTPKGERNLNGTQAAYTLHENGCAGVIGDQFVEVEISLPRADMNVKAGDTVRMYSWCNKDGGNLKSQYITLTF